MLDWLTGFNLLLIVGGVSFVAGVFSSQRVKDWLSGVPGEMRSALRNVEAVALARAKAAQAGVMNDLKVAAGVQPPPVSVQAAVAAAVAQPHV